MNEHIKIRNMDGGDVSFIFSSLLKSAYGGNPEMRRMRSGVFYDGQRRLIESVMARSDTRVLVACLDEDPETIFGYIIWSPKMESHSPILWYIYTKESFRRKGIAKGLWMAAGLPLEGDSVVATTHWTLVGADIIRRHNPVTYFNPFLLYGA